MRLIALSLLAWSLAVAALAEDLSGPARIEQAMFGDHRSETNTARNRYRHPVGTLTFFGLADGMTVMEIWPGAGWYTEILAPTIRNHGKFLVATYDVSVPDQPEYRYRLQKQLLAKFAARPDLYNYTEIVPFSPPESASLGSAESVDMVLTFRNIHGWINNGIAEQVFAQFYRVLKPGGVLGIVQHRARAGSDPEETAKRGYVSEQAVKDLAEAAGFKYEARSEVNRNPRDTKDYAEGVWTLPPTLRLEDKNRDKYVAIGESDRMTLRFRKPSER